MVAVTLLVLAGVAVAAPWLYSSSDGRSLGLLLNVMRSRETLDNPGVTGYYERLFAKTGRLDKNYVFDGSFRIFRFKAGLTWKHDLVTTNSLGLVGQEFPVHKPPGMWRVALLGGSLSSGHMVRPEQIWPTLLQNRLNAGRSGRRLEILNFGCVAYTLTQELDVAVEDLPRFEPDVYLLDLNELAIFRGWDRHLVQVARAGVDPKYDFLRSIFIRTGVRESDEELTIYGKLAPYRMEVIRKSIAGIQESANQHHASLIAVLMPAVEPGELSKRRLSGIQNLLASMSIPAIDALDSFDGILDISRLAAYKGDVHANALGHEMVAQNIYRKLQANPALFSAMSGEVMR